MSKKMTISVLARKTGISLQTIRYYESLDLLPDPERTASGYRQYTEDYIEHIVFVKNAQELGFSLDEIRTLVGLKFNRKAMGSDVKKIIRHKINDLDTKIDTLNKLKRYLNKLDSSCAGDMPTNCCPIINKLSV